MTDVYIPLNKIAGAIENDRVIVRITDWGKNKKPLGEVITDLDEADENDRVMKEILLGKWIYDSISGKSVRRIGKIAGNHTTGGSGGKEGLQECSHIYH